MARRALVVEIIEQTVVVAGRPTNKHINEHLFDSVRRSCIADEISAELPLAYVAKLINGQREVFWVNVLHGQVAIYGPIGPGALQLIKENDSVSATQSYAFAELAESSTDRVLIRKRCHDCGILSQALVGQAAADDSHCHTVVTLVQYAKTVDVTRAGRFYEFRVRELQPGSLPWPRQTVHPFHTVSVATRRK
jgi:hypothetical protein